MKIAKWMLLVMVGLNAGSLDGQVIQHARSQKVVAKKKGPMAKKLTPVVTNELRLLDDKGRTRLVMTTRSDNPVMELLRPDGTVGISVSLDANGHGSVQLSNPNTNGPVASLEIDDKGAHVKFDRTGGASSYLFLNNAGESGVVLLDPQGKRRVAMLAPAVGQSSIQRFDSDVP